MATYTVTDEDGDKHALFECDCCGRVPVFDLLREDDEDTEISDIFRDEDGLHKSKYVQPRDVFNPLAFDGRGEPSWNICDKCADWVKYVMNGGLKRALQDGEVRGYDK